MLGCSCFSVSFCCRVKCISCMYTATPPTPQVITELGAELPALYRGLPHLFYTWKHTHVSASSQFIPPASPLGVPTHPFPTSVPLFLPCKQVHLYHFSRFHIHALISTFFYFTVCDRHFSKEDIQMTETHEKMAKITNYQRNTDQTYNEVLPYLTQVRIAIIRKSINKKMLERMWRILLHYLWECRLIQSLWRTV